MLLIQTTATSVTTNFSVDDDDNVRVKLSAHSDIRNGTRFDLEGYFGKNSQKVISGGDLTQADLWDMHQLIGEALEHAKAAESSAIVQTILKLKESIDGEKELKKKEKEVANPFPTVAGTQPAKTK